MDLSSFVGHLGFKETFPEASNGAQLCSIVFPEFRRGWGAHGGTPLQLFAVIEEGLEILVDCLGDYL